MGRRLPEIVIDRERKLLDEEFLVGGQVVAKAYVTTIMGHFSFRPFPGPMS
jgi:hypothetical protein